MARPQHLTISLEVVSGQAYEKFMEQRVFRPLGMKDTFYVEPPEKSDRLCSIYAFENGQLKKQPREPRQGTEYVSPSGGWRSTASDLFAFYQMMLNGGTYRGARILSRASVGAMTAVQTGDLPSLSPGAGYGFGWEVVRDPLGLWSLYSIGSYSHGGAWRTLALVDPKRDLVVLFLTQLAAPPRQVPARSAFFNMAVTAIAD